MIVPVNVVGAIPQPPSAQLSKVLLPLPPSIQKIVVPSLARPEVFVSLAGYIATG